MRLAVFPHNSCWPSRHSPSGYATHGGIVLQIGSLSGLFEATRVIMPSAPSGKRPGEMPIKGHNLSVVALRPLLRTPLWRRLSLPLWLSRNGARVVAEMKAADAVFALVPGEIGTLVLLLAFILRKPLLVRYILAWARYCQKLWITAARTAVSAAARRSRTARLSRPFIPNCSRMEQSDAARRWPFPSKSRTR
jgi:hypothetical protein